MKLSTKHTVIKSFKGGFRRVTEQAYKFPKAVFGRSSKDYSMFEETGFLYSVGKGRAWEDLRFPATQLRKNPSSIHPEFDYTDLGLNFRAGEDDTIFIIAQMPHSRADNSPINPHVHWSPTSADTGNVIWKMEYRWVNVNDTIPTTWEDLDITVQAGGDRLNQINGFGYIDGTGKRISSMMFIKLSRQGTDALDTYTGIARLTEFDIHYLVDTAGSRQLFIK